LLPILSWCVAQISPICRFVRGVQWKHALKESYGYPWGMRLSDETGFDRPAALAKRPLIIAVRGEHEAQATLSWTISDSWSCTSGRDVTVFDSG
jgi:hypothetical protein